MDKPSHFIQQLREGDSGAFRDVWQTYYQDERKVARQFLGKHVTAVEDVDDIVSKHFGALLIKIANGELEHVGSRQHLGRVLRRRIRSGAIDLIRHYRAQKRGQEGLRERVDFDDCIDRSQEDAAEMKAMWKEFIENLPKVDLRAIANMKANGYTHEQIAEVFGLSVKSIDRKVKLIRQRWSEVHGKQAK